MKNILRRIWSLLLLGACSTGLLWAQQSTSPLSEQNNDEFIKQHTQQNRPKVELSAYTGFMFGGKFDRYNYYYDIEDAQDFGASLSVELVPNSWFELSYNYMSTTARYNEFGGASGTEDINVNYFQVGAQKVLPVHEKVQPFGVFSIGWTYFNRTYNGDFSAFSGILGGGVKILLTDRLGIRLQGRFMVPMYFSGFGFGVGTGGVSGDAYFGAYALQGDFSGGLILRL